MKIWKGPHFQKNYDDFMIFSYDKIYDGKFPVTNVRFPLIIKQ